MNRMKLCKGCRQFLVFSLFSVDTRTKSGVVARCKACFRKHYNDRKLAGTLPPTNKQRQSAQSKQRRLAMKLKVLAHYGTECACCGIKEHEFLCLDHIYGGGTKHRKIAGFRNLALWLHDNNFPPGFRTLCHNCNKAMGAMGAWGGACPHNNGIKTEPYEDRPPECLY